jgi:Flp pilus assembly protein TadG
MRLHGLMKRACAPRQRRIAGREEGAAAIEMAIAMIPLLMVVVGTMKVCLAIYSYHYVSEAAREGVRYAIVRGYTASSNQTLCVTTETNCWASNDNITSYVKGLGYPALTPGNMTVTVSHAAFPTGVTCVETSCSSPGNMVTVSLNYSFPISIPFAGNTPYKTLSSTTWQMSSTASAIIAQ